MRRIYFAAVLASFLALISSGCISKKSQSTEDLDKLVEDFIYGSLARSPVSATSNGYHQHDGTSLDEAVDDWSPAGVEEARKFYVGLEGRLAALDPVSLDKEQRVDISIIRNNLSLTLLDLNDIQDYRHNPTMYVELAGNALYTPSILNYAPKEQRFGQIIKRMEKLPALFEQAKANLVDSPDIWSRVAREENEGNIDLIDKTLRQDVPDAQKADYAKAAGPALAALRDFNIYLGSNFRSEGDWRLGEKLYARKFQYVLAIDKTPEQLLAAAEDDLKHTREEMAKLAAPKTVKQALDEIAKQHATADTYMAAAKKTLEEATAFVREKGLLTIPAGANLEVIETPQFMRGIYGVGGFNPAPVLEPQLGAFYWITPIPKDWTKDRIDSKLREYNNFGMAQLTVHEAMPGHYVQFQFANAVEPKSRRVLRSVFGNGAYIEGWAFYTQQMMTDEGFLNNAPGMRLTFYKQLLRVLANTILDIRLQTMGMTDQQALDLMINDTYQEKEEATAKLQRAQLSSCQLPMYYSGWKGWLEVREHDKQRKGSSFSLKDFHERALKESAVPLPALDTLLQ